MKRANKDKPNIDAKKNAVRSQARVDVENKNPQLQQLEALILILGELRILNSRD